MQVAFSEAELAELRRELQEQEQLIRGYQVSRAATCAGRHSQRCLQQICQLCASAWGVKRDADCSACCCVMSLLHIAHGNMHLSICARWLPFLSFPVPRAASDRCTRQRQAAPPSQFRQVHGNQECLLLRSCWVECHKAACCTALAESSPASFEVNDIASMPVPLQTENEAASEALKRQRAEAAHREGVLAEENARLERLLAQVQVGRDAPGQVL